MSCCNHVTSQSRTSAKIAGGRYWDGRQWRCFGCGTAPAKEPPADIRRMMTCEPYSHYAPYRDNYPGLGDRDYVVAMYRRYRLDGTPAFVAIRMARDRVLCAQVASRAYGTTMDTELDTSLGLGAPGA